MTNEEQKLREFADKWGIREDDEPTFDPHTENPYYGYSRRTKQCLSDLTALISEHYVAKAAYIALENTLAKAEAKNLELLQQRDELKEALILAEGLIDMASDKEWAKIRAAIKNTKDETDTIQR